MNGARQCERGPHQRPEFELIRRLVSPYRDISPDQAERSVNYTFNAVVADRWRDGRCFLLGDAAHMMPPFAGGPQLGDQGRHQLGMETRGGLARPL
ncbi:FAD-dependent monooxygenase [Nonomuraea sp. NPDC050202]|uniref:FAD-dependent monooxygenase n=1 Tax=Nonomuraea sp. NPDC050202 TaxID=3155035 RepID=UPI0033DABB1F